METLATITSQSQVHIPAKFRKALGFKRHGGRAIIKLEKKRIVIEPVKDDILKLAGKFHVKNPISAEKIRDYIDYAEGRY
jgi:bifunctional DNA-binding transcriptional regulator/antitoxin component of YhaV-PrlF toxin-antitoxin module